jgi:hypothetical protein
MHLGHKLTWPYILNYKFIYQMLVGSVVIGVGLDRENK